MPMTWTKIVTGASVALRPHCTMASGEAAITKDITPRAIIALGAGDHIGRLGHDLGRADRQVFGRVLHPDLVETR